MSSGAPTDFSARHSGAAAAPAAGEPGISIGYDNVLHNNFEIPGSHAASLRAPRNDGVGVFAANRRAE